MTFREQYAYQRAHAQDLVNWGVYPRLTLYAQSIDGHRVVSIVGGAIVDCMPDMWRAQGAYVHRLAVITAP